MTSDSSSASRQGISYVLVGGGTALLELGLFQLLYELIGLPLEVSNVMATIVATATNFMLNRSVTFKSTSNPVRSAILYCLLFAFNTTVSTFAIGFMVGLNVPSAIAKVLMQGAVVIWNFFIYRMIIFK